MPRRFAGRTRPGKKIDFKQWAAIPSGNLGTAAAVVQAAGGLSFSDPGTILRVRGQYAVGFDGGADGDLQKVGFGIAVLATDVFLGAVASMPTPLGDVDYPWLFWYESNLQLTVPIAGESSSDIMAFERVVVDSKAMRKVKPNETVFYIVQTSAAVPTDIAIGQMRVLIGT